MSEKKHSRRRAVAVKGAEPNRMAPSIAARGTGCLAEKIIALAREHNIPIREDPDLVSILARLDLEQSLPVELYPLIAELLGFAYHLNQAVATGPTAGDTAPPKPEGEAASAGAEKVEGEESERAAQYEVEPGEAVMDELPRPPALPEGEEQPEEP